MLSKSIELLSLVMLLLPMVFFMLASPPLLVLKHDTPQDARFIRGLFNSYYTVVVVAAGFGALGRVVVGQTLVSLAMIGVAALVFSIRRWFIPRMDRLQAQIAAGDTAAIPQFRRLHIAGMLLNIVQLGVVTWVMAKLVAP